MAEKSKQSSELVELKKQCESCCKELAALKKEVAALKKVKSSGGADPRLDKLIKAILEKPSIDINLEDLK